MLEQPIEPLEPVEPPRYRWGVLDLVAFGVFFFVTVLVFSFAAIKFIPNVQESVSTAVMVQGIMNSVIVGFILLLVKVHGLSIKETIHWQRNYPYSTGLLLALGVMLSLGVMITSTLFPQAAQTPIEKLLSSAKSLYVFAIFGIVAAPFFEEIIFRGFLFKAFSDMGGRGVAIPATALLFAGLHALQLWGNLGAIAMIFLVGYILALIRDRSNSLIPGLLVHTAYNATLFGMYAVSTVLSKWVGKT